MQLMQTKESQEAVKKAAELKRLNALVDEDEAIMWDFGTPEWSSFYNPNSEV